MKPKRELSELFDALSAPDQHALLSYARFLQARSQAEHAAPTQTAPPQVAPAAVDETVIGALKRLTAGYPMLDKSKLLDQTTVLVAQHTLQGRDKGEVIAELERIFSSHYQKLLDGRE